MSTAWPSVRLGDVLKERREQPQAEGLTLGRIPIVSKIRFDTGTVELRQELGTSTGMILVRPGDLLLSGINAAKGAIAIFGSENAEPVAATIHYGAYSVVSTRADAKFLWWYLRSRPFRQILAEALPEGIKTELKAGRLLPIVIPLPPLPEQRRVVERIEDLGACIAEVRRLRKLNAADIKVLGTSQLTRSLSWSRNRGHVELPDVAQKVRRGVELPTAVSEVPASWSVPDGWLRISVAELLLRGALLDVKDGNHGSNHPRSSEFVSDGTPFLMASDIQGGEILWSSASRLANDTIARLRVGFAVANDVLFTHKASIGKTAIADRACVLSPQVTYYRCNPRYVDPRWLEAFLRSPLFLGQLSEIQSQSTRDFVSISKQYRQFVLLPPLNEQKRIVGELSALQADLCQLEALQLECEVGLDALLPSVLDRAFKGEL